MDSLDTYDSRPSMVTGQCFAVAELSECQCKYGMTNGVDTGCSLTDFTRPGAFE